MTNKPERDFADVLVAVESLLNDQMEMLVTLGIPMRLEAEVINQPHLPSRIHLRMVTPEMEVKDDLPAKPRKVSSRAASEVATG